MYIYDSYDKQMLQDRIAPVSRSDQTFSGWRIKQEQFLPLRLQNGLYIQRLAPMLRVAIPYGCLSSQSITQTGLHSQRL